MVTSLPFWVPLPPFTAISFWLLPIVPPNPSDPVASTPGAMLASCRTLLISKASSMKPRSATWPRSALAVCSMGLSARTVTISPTAPTSRAKFKAILSFT